MKRLFVVVALTSAGCGAGGIERGIDDILNPAPPPANSGPKPVEEVLETAVEATHISTVVLSALFDTGACAAVTSGCTEPGCDFAIDVDVNECSVPIADGGGSGIVVVTGSVTGPDSATLFANFANLELAGPAESGWLVAGIAFMTATRSGDRVNLVYAQQNVTIRSGVSATSAELSQHIWTSEAVLAGTPADPSDDLYTISGGIQETEAGTSGAYVTQAVLGGVEIAPACRRNPNRGSAVVERIGAGPSIVLSMVHLGFHDACDGRADIVSAFGTDMFSLGGTVKMDLLD